MIDSQKKSIIETIVRREEFRHVSRTKRLLHEPFRTFIYYIFATLSHIKPYKKTFKTLWGTDMTSYLPEGNTFFYYGYCEANLTNFLLRFLKEGDVVLDVGAHVGIYTMLSSTLVGSTGSVHSFEPTPWTFDLLKENTKQLTNVILNNKAVSDMVETISFMDYGPGFGAYNTANKGGSTIKKPSTIITTETAVLDDYCKEKNIKPVFIKLDAEGYEYAILQGMDYIFKEIRPVVTLEVAGGDEWKENCKKSIDLLLSKKYKSYEMSLDGHIASHTLQENYVYDNLLFIPEEKHITV